MMGRSENEHLKKISGLKQNLGKDISRTAQ